MADPFPPPEGAPDPTTLADVLATTDVETLVDVAYSDDLADEDPRPTPQDAAYRWRITGVETAEWAMLRYAEADAVIAAAEAQRDEWIARYEAWFREETRSADSTRRFMRAHLQRWALDERERTGKATMNLPSGRVSTRHTAAAPTIPKDGEAKKDAAGQVVAWAFEYGYPEVINPDVSLSALRRVGRVAEVTTYTLEFTDAPPLSVQEGQDVICTECGAVRVVMAVEQRTAVVDPENNVIPGAIVDPPHTTASVSIR
jgi:hypothetical protein